MLYSNPDYDPKKEAQAQLDFIQPVKQYKQETLK